jgi:FixJ family two-component response regulator
MESFKNSRIGIIGSNLGECETLTRLIHSWGLSAKGFARPGEVFENVSGNRVDVVLIEISMFDSCGPNLIMKTGRDLKIIVITEAAYRQLTIRALRQGAFNMLEKPFSDDLLRHSMLTALRSLENERKIRKLTKDLEDYHLQVLSHKLRLEKLNSQLLETNRALSVFARNVERERGEIENRIVLQVRELVMPVIARMRGDRNLQASETHLNVLSRQIDDLTSGPPTGQSFVMGLSSAETRIAYFVKQGISTETIAKQLHISENTVRTHRKNIRRKLKIGAKYSLRNFLNSGGSQHQYARFPADLVSSSV